MKRPRSSLDRVGYFLLHLKKTCNFFVSADPNLPALGIYFIDILQVTKTVLAISKLRPMSFPITLYRGQKSFMKVFSNRNNIANHIYGHVLHFRLFYNIVPNFQEVGEG